MINYKYILVIFLTNISMLFADSPRMSVLEVLTNTNSPSCAERNIDFIPFVNERINSYIPIFYHTDFPGCNDHFNEIAKPLVDERLDYYKSVEKISTFPYAYLSGNHWRGDIYFHNLIEQENKRIIEQISPIDIVIDMKFADNQYRVDIDVKSSQNLGNKKIYIYLMEYYYNKFELPANKVSNGENNFYYIPRKRLNQSEHNINLQTDSSNKYTYIFDYDKSYKKNNMYVNVFIQDSTSSDILQAETNLQFIPCEMTTTNNEYYKHIEQKGTDDFKVKIFNPNAIDIDYNINVKANSSLDECFSSTSRLSIPAGEIRFFNVTYSSNSNDAFTNITVNATPILTSIIKYIGVKSPSSIKIHYLKNDAKFLTLYTNDDNKYNIVNAVKLQTDYYKYWAVMDYSIYMKYYRNIDFKIIHFNENSGVEPVWAFNIPFTEHIINRIYDGTNVIISSVYGLKEYDSNYSNSNDCLVKEFYEDILGVSLNKNYSTKLNDYNSIPFEISSNTVIKPLITIDKIQANTSNRYFTPKLESLYHIEGKSETILKVIKVDSNNIQNNNNVATYVKLNDAHIVYTTFGIDIIDNQKSGALLLSEILSIMGYPPVKRIIDFDKHEMNFFVDWRTYDTISMKITNTGNTMLNISDVYFEGNTDSLFSCFPNIIGVDILPHEHIILNMVYHPIDDDNRKALLYIKSNAQNDPIKKTELYGYTNPNKIDDLQAEIRIFPNPASNYIYIEKENISNYDFSLYNVLGEKQEFTMEFTPNRIKILYDIVPAGIYYIQIYNKNENIIKPIIIK